MKTNKPLTLEDGSQYKDFRDQVGRYEIRPPFTNESYVHLYKDGKIWIGSIERTIAIEIVKKMKWLSDLVESSSHVSTLQAEAAQLKIDASNWAYQCDQAKQERDKAEAEIEALRKEREWIPVSERLPDSLERVWFCLKSGNFLCLCRGWYVENSDGGFFVSDQKNDFYFDINDVQVWQKEYRPSCPKP